MAHEDSPPEQRVSISLSTLRAELTSLELRLVDRLNGALAQKADRVAVESMVTAVAKNDARLTVLEQQVVKKDSPLVEEIEELRQASISLAEVGRYKRWLWAQTAALGAIGIGIAAFILDHLAGGAA